MTDRFESLKNELEATQERLASLQADLAKEQEAAQQKLVDDVRAHCEANGWAIEDIAARLAPKRAARARGASRKPAKHYTDPKTGNVYRGRGMPHWLRDRMVEEGLNPESPEDRVKFRTEVLVAEAA